MGLPLSTIVVFMSSEAGIAGVGQGGGSLHGRFSSRCLGRYTYTLTVWLNAVCSGGMCVFELVRLFGDLCNGRSLRERSWGVIPPQAKRPYVRQFSPILFRFGSDRVALLTTQHVYGMSYHIHKRCFPVTGRIQDEGRRGRRERHSHTRRPEAELRC